MNESKMVIVMYPRERKMIKEQLIRQTAINAIMSLVSIGGGIKSGSQNDGGPKLQFPLAGDPSNKGIPQNWFTGDSHFHVEVRRIAKDDKYAIENENAYNTLYYWCKQSGIPVFKGEENGDQTMMVIGPYWKDSIEKVFSRAIPIPGTVRPFSGERGDE